MTSWISEYVDEVIAAEEAEANGTTTPAQAALLDEFLEAEFAVQDGTATDEQRIKFAAYRKRRDELARGLNVRRATARIAGGYHDPLARGMLAHYAPARGIRPMGRERRPACNQRQRGSRRARPSTRSRARSPGSKAKGEPPGEHLSRVASDQEALR